MFIRRIPYQSVERRRIHNWWLLLLRIAAMALVIAAFSRPFFADGRGDRRRRRHRARARSSSCSTGRPAWATAITGRARRTRRGKIVDGLGGEDRATLVLFDRGVEEAVRATTDRGELELADRARPPCPSDATRYAPALREAQSLLSRSDRGRKEAFLISDFQKTGWERQEEIQPARGRDDHARSRSPTSRRPT